MKIKYKILFLTSLLIITTTIFFSFINYNNEKKVLLNGLDEKLLTAAYFAKDILPKDYHDKIIDKHSVSTEEYFRIVDIYNQLCLKLGLQYIWSLININDQIVFTSSTSTNKNAPQEEYASFFETHTNPDEYKNAFTTMQTQYSTFNDKWGQGRMVLVPYFDSNGRRYLFAASVSIDDINLILKKRLVTSAIISGIVFLIGMILTFLFSNSLSKPIVQIADAAKSIGKGNFVNEIKVSSNDEIGMLASTLNKIFTDLKKAEETLKESEQKYRELVQYANSIILRWSPDGRINFMNNFALQFFGYSESEIIGKKLIGTIVPENESTGRDLVLIIQEITENPEKYESNENENICSDGKRVWISWTNKPIVDINGQLIEVLSVGNDITGRTQAEKELKEQYSFTNNIIESSIDAIVVTDSQGVIIRSNKAYQKLLGFSEKEIIGKHTAETAPMEEGRYESTTGEIHQVNESSLLSGAVMIEKLFEEKHVYNQKAYLLRKDRKVVPVEESLVLLNDINGEPIGAVGILRDITEHKQIEDMLRQSQKMEAVGTLAGGIAHDFNNILGGIIGYAELAQDDLSTNNPVQEYLGGILKSSTRAKDLVKQILTFSRKSQGSRKPTLVYPIVKEVSKLLRSTTPTTIEFKLNIDETSGMVNADPTQIHQVVMNLCTNAVHSMQETGGVLGFDLSCIDLKDENKEGFHDLELGPYIKLKISDTGSGIDSSILTRIFEPFFTTKTEEKGTGMGLSVVHGIVKSYDGDIIAKSQIGQGSTFTVLLPQLVAEHKKKEDIAVAIPKGTECILFVDDEKALLDVGEKTLQSLGYTVIGCSSSLEALEIFEQQPSKFDLVITDQTMPHMTGFDLAKRILGTKPTASIILCTGYSDTVSSEIAEALGIKALVYKPISKKEIAGTIREVLDKHNHS